jgi:putative RNA 2'-phosphotransferase
MDKSLARVSRFRSLILRRKPEAMGMQLDRDGWLEVNALIANANRHGGWRSRGEALQSDFHAW